ncbi:MAG: alpha/beta fold hydrolase [Burkholderiaceae bacterium]
MDALLRSRVPLRLITHGACDPNSGRHMVQRLLELAPGTDVVSLERTGHWPHIEVPAATAKAILDFIQACSA